MVLLKDTTCCDESSDCEVIEPVTHKQTGTETNSFSS